MAEPLLKVEGLKKYFPIKSGVFQHTVGFVHAVDDIGFTVYEQKTFALVGESGCGKSTTGRSIIRILEPTAGKVVFDGENILEYSKAEMRSKRKDMQLIFQNPYSSLNPRMTVRRLLSEPLKAHFDFSKKEVEEQVEWMTDKVGLSRIHLERYPHQFSGGQRQRISIARAIIMKPRLVVADEPVSALDVSIQSQILNLLMKLQQDMKLTYVFISHDLNVVRHISDQVGVMYLGQMMEMGDTSELYDRPLHPYTNALFSAIPSKDPLKKKNRIILKGDVPNPANPPSGCPFHLRCPNAMSVCREEKPKYIEALKGHFVACHIYCK